ncbi:deoxynucleoside kinase [Mycoplasmopsis hyopharyngis]|uniref:deoxynucleoside kinase n=1 Tax=Mycoplasmopsis hyopharyngis TaxID=29558 RepID=UPI003872C55A
MGAGAVGKTTVLNELKEYFKEINMNVYDERDFLGGKFIAYMKDMKLNSYEMQKLFFIERYKQIVKMQFDNFSIIDRHLIDDVIFPEVHINLNNFNPSQKNKWIKFEKKYLRKLETKPKLDILFVLRANYEEIKQRRNKRSEIDEERKSEADPKNDEFFKQVNQIYFDENLKWMFLANKFAKEIIIFDNQSKEDVKTKIKERINQAIKE